MKRVNFVFWLGFACALALLLAAGSFAALHIALPSDGAYLKPGEDVWRPEGIVVTPISSDYRGLEKGDIVVAVAGRNISHWIEDFPETGSFYSSALFGQELLYTVIRAGNRLDVSVKLGRFPLAAILSQQWGAFSFGLVNLLVAAFVFAKRPGEQATQLYLLMSIFFGGATVWSFGLQVSDLAGGLGLWLYLISTSVGYVLAGIVLLHFWLVFPEKHPLLSRRPWILPVIYLFPFALLAVYIVWTRSQAEMTATWIRHIGQGVGLIELVYFSLILLAAVSGYRSAQNPDSRTKVRWVVFALMIVILLPLLFGTIPTIALGKPILDWNYFAISGLLMPVSIAVAILRYQLFDIDLIINRTLVYGTLTTGVVGIYALGVGGLSVLFQSSGNLIVSLLATGLAALLFQPLQARLQSAVNRMMYGERDDPYAVLSHLGQRLEASISHDNILLTVVETISQTLKLPYVAIDLRAGDNFERVASYGLEPAQDEADQLMIPLIYQNETIGRLILAPRSSGEYFSREEQRLLTDIARQVGVAARTVQLTGHLQRSRQRIITTLEEERRRLRRDLHDGLGPQLASLTLKIDAARNLLKQTPDEVEPVLIQLKKETQSALKDIRRIAYDLRPPALDELGLIPALNEKVASLNEHSITRISFESPENIEPLPAAVEVAAYRIAMEALTNVIHHSKAKNCRLQINAKQRLEMEICDDGGGLPEDFRVGVGLSSMRERAAELGGECHITRLENGGTRVLVKLPLNNVHSQPAAE
ncbi:MAG TPA: histidine kinase [Anaerolineales bacterium]